MPLQPMRWIDKHVGNIFISALSLFHKQRDSVPNISCKNIIISKYFGLGSILMATPLLQLLRSLFPDSRIIVVTLKQNASFLHLFPFVDDVISIDRQNFLTLIRSTLTVIRVLRGIGGDIFFDLEFFSRYSAIVSFLSRCSCTHRIRHFR